MSLRLNIIIALSLSALLSPSATANSQQTKPKPSKKSTEGQTFSTPGSQDQAKEVVALGLDLANRILAFKDVNTKALSVAKIANLVWKLDEPLARSLFEKSINLSSTGSPEEIKDLAVVRRRVIALVARTDPEWAKRLIEATTKTSSGQDLKSRSSLNLGTALSLLERDEGRAIEFAGRSLGEEVQAESLLTFLLTLRKTNEPAASQFFLQALKHLSSEQKPSVRAFHTLGVYLFTSPALLDSDSYAITVVDSLVVPNLSATRPGISPALVRDYLAFAPTILWRAVNDPEQQKNSYVLGHLLLPKAKSLAPDLVAAIEASMSAISGSVPSTLTNDSAYKYVEMLPPSLEESLANAEQKPDQYSRDIAYFDIAAQAWRRNDFKTARKVGSRISDAEVSKSFALIIDFGEVMNLARKNPRDLDVMRQKAERLSAGIERALVFLELARLLAESGQKSLSEEAVDLALKASSGVDDARRPLLILKAAAQLAPFDRASAQLIWSNAIKDFNRFDDHQYSNIDWNRTIRLGALSLDFPLLVTNVDMSFERSFSLVLIADLDAGIPRATELRNENLRARGYVEIVAAQFKKIEKSEVNTITKTN